MKKGNYSKFLIVGIIALNIWFTVRILNILEQGYNEPGILIGAWFSFTTGELFMIASIKKKKVVKENDTII